MSSNQSVIVAGVRTPMGAFMGALAGVPAAQLGATCVKALLERTGLPPDRVDDVIMGTCIAAGQGMNPARQVAIHGGLSPNSHALTVNEACASGLRAVMLADQIIRIGDAGVVIAGTPNATTSRTNPSASPTRKHSAIASGRPVSSRR